MKTPMAHTVMDRAPSARVPMNRISTMTVSKEVARAHIETLVEWASLYEQSGMEGSAEVGFLMKRAARQIAKVHDLKVPNLPAEPRVPEPSVEDLRDG